MTTASIAMFQPTNDVFGSLLRRWTERDATLRGLIARSVTCGESTAAVTPSVRPIVKSIGSNYVEPIVRRDVDRIGGGETDGALPALLIAC